MLTEAREAGCAIVASDVDGIPETLDNRQAGILVPPKDSQTLATALAQLLSNPVQLQYWKNRAKQNLERFSAARVHEETMTVYRELVKNYSVRTIMEAKEVFLMKTPATPLR